MRIAVLAALALATVAVVCSADPTQEYDAGELLEMPPTPPMAGESEFVEDTTGDEMMADTEKQDVVMDLMQDAMDKTGDFASEEAKIALKHMDQDLKNQKYYQKQIEKNLEEKAKKQKKNDKKFDAFAALRSKFPHFGSDGELVEQDSSSSTEDDSTADTTDDTCAACIDQFDTNGGCDAWKSAKTSEAVSGLVPAGCDHCAHAAYIHCGIDEAHVQKQQKHLAPTHYSVVPVGEKARKADADLAAGADADRKEDWQVHAATYHALHPSARRMAKIAAKKAEKKPPAIHPLEKAQEAFHHGLDTITQTKDIAATPLVKLTLDDAKKSCGTIRGLAKKKCDTDAHNTHFFCITEGTTEKQCDTEKEKDAAECKVAHETAYNKCFSLWKRAKKNIHAARERAAAPMKHTDEMVKTMTDGTTKCASLMKTANKDCSTAFDKYHDACKKSILAGFEADFLQEVAPKAVAKATAAVAKAADSTKKDSGKKIAKKAAADSKAALKKAEHQLKKEAATGAAKDAIVKCELKKNIAKRTCIKAVHEARDSCDKLTSAMHDDHDQD